MRSYTWLCLIILLGLGSATAQASPTGIDPTVILRGGGGSEPVIFAFSGAFSNPGTDNTTYQNITSQPFTGITLNFNVTAGGPLTFSCGDPTLDPFFTSCMIDPTNNNRIIFFGMDGGHPGIGPLIDFNVFIPDLPNPSALTFTGTANGATALTPEPTSALLFLSGVGAIAGFLKRRSNSPRA
jgi:hypothetical protein